MLKGWASELSLDVMIRCPVKDEIRRGLSLARGHLWSDENVWFNDEHPWDHAKDFAIISKMVKEET